MLLHERCRNEDRYTAHRGIMVIQRPAPRVELISGHGFASQEFIAPILESRNQTLVAYGQIALFDDLERVSGYDSRLRVELTAWAREHRAKITAHHILTSSRLVAMGVAVASLALGSSICAHSHRADFEAALQKEIKRRLPAA